MNTKKYWKSRSELYNNLQWAKDFSLLDVLVDFCDLDIKDKVLDVGCGTGAVSNAVYGTAGTIHAMDVSQSMLDKGNFKEGIVPFCDNIVTYRGKPGFYSKILCRMVLHHVFDLEPAFKNMLYMLELGGSLIIQEGIPPSSDFSVSLWYNDTMQWKEDRISMHEDIFDIFLSGCCIEKEFVTYKNFSVGNWIDNSVHDENLREFLYTRHINAPEYIKDVYNMKITENDILIDTRFMLLRATKVQNG